MMSEGWKTYKLSDLSERITSGGTPLTTRSEFYGGKIPWLKTQEINFNRVYDTETHITEDGLKNSSAKWISENSVIVAMYGATAGKVALTKIPLTTNQACCNITVDPKLADYNFIYYNLLSRYSEISRMSTGAAQQNLNSGMLKDLLVTVPDLQEQSRIASILSSLDDKIELNLQMNKTLEAIAQAIFKEWFVDFRFPGFDGELVDGLPKGWRNGHLVDILDLRYGKALKSEERKEGKYPVVGSEGVVGTNNSYFVTGPGIVIGRKGTIGKVYWIEQNFYPIDTTFFIKDTIGVPSLYFHYFIVRDQDFQRISSDSAVPGLNKNEALKNRVVVPDVQFVNLFNDLIKPLFDKIKVNSDNITTLTSLRDSLLPKLINGKIRVS